MKFVYIVVSLFMCGHVFAATLLTSCPTGYTALREKTVFATAAVKCESGYAGSTTLINACVSGSVPFSGVCWLVSQTETDYSDSVGIYQFNEPCPYDDSGTSSM